MVDVSPKKDEPPASQPNPDWRVVGKMELQIFECKLHSEIQSSAVSELYWWAGFQVDDVTLIQYVDLRYHCQVNLTIRHPMLNGCRAKVLQSVTITTKEPCSLTVMARRVAEQIAIAVQDHNL